MLVRMNTRVSQSVELVLAFNAQTFFLLFKIYSLKGNIKMIFLESRFNQVFGSLGSRQSEKGFGIKGKNSQESKFCKKKLLNLKNLECWD